MGRIINSTYISLDGVVEQPHLWPTIDRPDDERGLKLQTDLLLARRVRRRTSTCRA
jgi:hypothetical protein